MDADTIKLDKARYVADRTRYDGSKRKSLASLLGGCEFKKTDEGLLHENFDLIHVVNVLHHLHPYEELPDFLFQSFQRLTRNGFLVIEDFFIGDYPSKFAQKKFTFAETLVIWVLANWLAFFCFPAEMMESIVTFIG